MDKPATAPWGVRISDADFEKLQAGFVAVDMDDKWDIKAAEADQSGVLSITITRSWTGHQHYILNVKPSDGGSGAKIEAITWEQNMSGNHVTEEQGKLEAVILCRSLLECELEELPDYDESQFWNFSSSKADTN
jgi:hypothetical protein